jgi:hypothetical protein
VSLCVAIIVERRDSELVPSLASIYFSHRRATWCTVEENEMSQKKSWSTVMVVLTMNDSIITQRLKIVTL